MTALVVAKQGTIRSFLPHLLAGAVYAHHLIFGQENPINGVTWSLEVEVQFYILMPVFAAVFVIGHRTARRAVLVGFGALAALTSIPLYHTYFGATILYYMPFFWQVSW